MTNNNTTLWWTLSIPRRHRRESICANTVVVWLQPLWNRLTNETALIYLDSLSQLRFFYLICIVLFFKYFKYLLYFSYALFIIAFKFVINYHSFIFLFYMWIVFFLASIVDSKEKVWLHRETWLITAHMTINFETLKLKILWRLIYKRRQIFSRLQSIWIRWAQLICHTSRCRGLDSAGCQLVLFCLYSYESKPAELLWHLLNFCPAAATSRFAEFQNFCFTFMRFWLDFDCNQVYAIRDFYQLITINHPKQIACNLSQTDGRLILSYLSLS